MPSIARDETARQAFRAPFILRLSVVVWPPKVQFEGNASVLSRIIQSDIIILDSWPKVWPNEITTARKRTATFKSARGALGCGLGRRRIDLHGRKLCPRHLDSLRPSPSRRSLLG